MTDIESFFFDLSPDQRVETRYFPWHSPSFILFFIYCYILRDEFDDDRFNISIEFSSVSFFFLDQKSDSSRDLIIAYDQSFLQFPETTITALALAVSSSLYDRLKYTLIACTNMQLRVRLQGEQVRIYR